MRYCEERVSRSPERSKGDETIPRASWMRSGERYLRGVYTEHIRIAQCRLRECAHNDDVTALAEIDEIDVNLDLYTPQRRADLPFDRLRATPPAGRQGSNRQMAKGGTTSARTGTRRCRSRPTGRRRPRQRRRHPCHRPNRRRESTRPAASHQSRCHRRRN